MHTYDCFRWYNLKVTEWQPDVLQFPPIEHDLMLDDGTAELRWRSPVMDDKWLPPARAGHSAVTLPLKTNRTLCSVTFGGYNGHECFNDVIVFDCGKQFCIF